MKILAPLIAFAFVLPIVTAFCCCSELFSQEKHSDSSEALTASHQESGHSHDSRKSERPHANTKDESDCGRHDHSQCSHPQLIAYFVNHAAQFSAAQIPYLQKFSSAHFKGLEFFQRSVKPRSSPLFWNTGPPVFDLSKTPLYLQISILRI